MLFKLFLIKIQQKPTFDLEKHRKITFFFLCPMLPMNSMCASEVYQSFLLVTDKQNNT